MRTEIQFLLLRSYEVIIISELHDGPTCRKVSVWQAFCSRNSKEIRYQVCLISMLKRLFEFLIHMGLPCLVQLLTWLVACVGLPEFSEQSNKAV